MSLTLQEVIGTWSDGKSEGPNKWAMQFTFYEEGWCWRQYYSESDGEGSQEVVELASKWGVEDNIIVFENSQERRRRWVRGVLTVDETYDVSNTETLVADIENGKLILDVIGLGSHTSPTVLIRR